MLDNSSDLLEGVIWELYQFITNKSSYDLERSCVQQFHFCPVKVNGILHILAELDYILDTSQPAHMGAILQKMQPKQQIVNYF